MNKSIGLVVLKQLKNIGNKKLIDLNIKDVTDVKTLYNLYEEKLCLRYKNIEKIDFNQFNKIYKNTQILLENNYKKDIHLLNFFDKNYPKNFLRDKDMPAFILYKGNIDALNMKSIAVIGTREPSKSGKKLANRYGEYLASKNISVVSGLAVGIDSEAHKGCLNNNGVTVAILPMNIENIYPKNHEYLAEEIVSKNGCLITEYVDNAGHLPGQLVSRDRLQALLSNGLIVVETGVEGGSWNAINKAIKYNINIGAFDYNKLKNNDITNSEGNNKLIKENIANPLYSKDSLESFLDLCFKDKKVKENAEISLW